MSVNKILLITVALLAVVLTLRLAGAFDCKPATSPQASTASGLPVISDIQAGSISSTGAVITWKTDRPARGQVKYGLSSAYGFTGGAESTQVTFHEITLPGLQPATTYHFTTVSTDSKGQQASSTDRTFMTTTPPLTGKIVFVSMVDRREQIATINADSSKKTYITSGNGRNFSPAWSPDGRRIVFATTRHGIYDFYIMNADGSNEVRVENNIGNAFTPAGGLWQAQVVQRAGLTFHFRPGNWCDTGSKKLLEALGGGLCLFPERLIELDFQPPPGFTIVKCPGRHGDTQHLFQAECLGTKLHLETCLAP